MSLSFRKLFLVIFPHYDEGFTSQTFFKKNLGGFTLIELLIVLAIVGIMAAIILGDLPSFDENERLRIVAEEVSLSFRETQFYGAGVLISESGGSPFTQVFPNRYGIYVDKDGPTHFTIFADSDDTFTFTPPSLGGTDIIQTTLTSVIKQPIFFKDLCRNLNGTSGAEVCGVAEATVLFERPNLEPTINTAGENDVQYIKIVLSNSQSTQNIYIWASGQISVINPNQVLYVQ